MSWPSSWQKRVLSLALLLKRLRTWKILPQAHQGLELLCPLLYQWVSKWYTLHLVLVNTKLFFRIISNCALELSRMISLLGSPKLSMHFLPNRSTLWVSVNYLAFEFCSINVTFLLPFRSTLHSPTDPIGLRSDSNRTIGLPVDSDQTIGLPLDLGVHWSFKLVSENENCLHPWDLNPQPLIYSLYKHILRCSNHLS